MKNYLSFLKEVYRLPTVVGFTIAALWLLWLYVIIMLSIGLGFGGFIIGVVLAFLVFMPVSVLLYRAMFDKSEYREWIHGSRY